MGRPPAAVDPIHLRTLASQFSDEEIGLQLGFARVTITGARRRLGIPSFTEATGLKRRDGAVTHGGRRRRVSFDEGFFASLNSEAPAYFLGLIAADGSIAQRGNTLEITLAEPDEHILHDFILAIGGDGCAVKQRTRADREKTFHRLTLCSKELVNDLLSWGMRPRKTFTLELLRPIPAPVARHFLRGFWDGDGSIGRTHFSLGVQSQAFAEQLLRMITAVGGQRPAICQKTIPSGKPFFEISVKAKRFEDFRKELYRDCRFFMKRKQAAYLNYWC